MHKIFYALKIILRTLILMPGLRGEFLRGETRAATDVAQRRDGQQGASDFAVRFFLVCQTDFYVFLGAQISQCVFSSCHILRCDLLLGADLVRTILLFPTPAISYTGNSYNG